MRLPTRLLRQASTALFATAITAILLGCSSTAPPAPSADAAKTASGTTHSWQGRMGLQVQDPYAQEQSLSASFHLQGDANSGSLDIFSPLGTQLAQLQWQPGWATLQQGNQRTESPSLDALLQQSLGTTLPVAALFGWLQGQAIAAPGWQVDLSRHAQGRIQALRTAPLPQATLRVVLQAN